MLPLDIALSQTPKTYVQVAVTILQLTHGDLVPVKNINQVDLKIWISKSWSIELYLSLDQFQLSTWYVHPQKLSLCIFLLKCVHQGNILYDGLTNWRGKYTQLILVTRSLNFTLLIYCRTWWRIFTVKSVSLILLI